MLVKQCTFGTMEFDEAREHFISTWGNYGKQWGINKPMGQIQALLLISKKHLCTDEVMEQLQISRGNANMNIRALLSLGLIHKVHIPKERKEYFRAEKDISAIARIFAAERKRRGIDPIIKSLLKVKDTSGKAAQIKEFRKTVRELSDFAFKADRYMEKLMDSF